MSEILGIDLGTGSIGLAIRNTELGVNLVEQLEHYSATTFKRGVGKGKSGEISFAANRTKYRSSRRLYQARKYRIWATLDVLIKYGYCPLSIVGLDKWRKYDKAKGLKREYPMDEKEFSNWIILDFNGDGQPDYSSPFQLRSELVTNQLDMDHQINKYKLGRALYHIAQRRGFKSSKSEKGNVVEINSDEKQQMFDQESGFDFDSLKKSEELKSKDIEVYREKYSLPTVGCAFAKLEKEGIRVRNSLYQAIRSQNEFEMKCIFNFQNDLSISSDFFEQLFHAIFYKRPLRSQKGLVGKCTLEPNKSRCPISHPEFEFFRAWSFLNNIKYSISEEGPSIELTNNQKLELYNDKFLRVKISFKFEEIRIWIEKNIGQKIVANYKDYVSVSGCPISARLKNLFGNDWKNLKIDSGKVERKKNGILEKIIYTYEDVWHVCFSFDDEEHIAEFGKTSLKLNDKEIKSLINLWAALPQGYSMLSYKAICKINRFLSKGLSYTEAVLIAKLPDILGAELWITHEAEIIKHIGDLIENNRRSKEIIKIINSLISNYKSLEFEGQFAYKNCEYLLKETDFKDVRNAAEKAYGELTWEMMTLENKDNIISEITQGYQDFFNRSDRKYRAIPTIVDEMKQFLSSNFTQLHCVNNFIDKITGLPCNCPACKNLNKLYHPSKIEYYSPSKLQSIEWKGVMKSLKLLDSPDIGFFKNPVALRTLHILRNNINYLLKEGKINDDTKVVVELARDLNDANMRHAIEAFQKEREKENRLFSEIVSELFNGITRPITDEEVDKTRLYIEQCELSTNETKDKQLSGSHKMNDKVRLERYRKDITKYRLWIEQRCMCIYTGKVIKLSDLFDETKVDFEHTIPKSISFDNSLANLTICDRYYNRVIKKNRIPFQLENYENNSFINGELYTAILPRIQKWIDKVEHLKINVNNWKAKSRYAQNKVDKDDAIRQFHMWRMELDYWQNKVDRFKMKEVKSGFINSQLVDTRVISKYALHYLKSLFSHVEIQKGSVTAEFRKILGIQDESLKKDRSKHSHHAIDAAVLTLIPSAAQRDKMLRLHYEIEESSKSNNNDISFLKQQLKEEIRSCRLGSVKGVVSEIEKNILINNVSRDRILNPSKRKDRSRGKEIFVIDNLGYKKNKWLKGDSIRGQLHGESFYGAIKQALIDDQGNIVRNSNGTIEVDETTKYVIRKPLKYKKDQSDSGFTDWKDLGSKIVDKNLFEMIRNQYPDATFSEACEIGVYMIDKQGRKINRIRHVRCYATNIVNPLKIKKQTYLSNKEYKQFYYTEVGDLYVMCKYSNSKEKEFKIFSLFDVSENRKSGQEDILNSITTIKGEKLFLQHIIKQGSHLLIYDKYPEEVIELDREQKLKRLFIVNGFESDGKRIIMRRHINAQEDKLLGKGGSIKDIHDLPEKIRCSINSIKYLLEGVDFSISLDGEITFYD